MPEDSPRQGVPRIAIAVPSGDMVHAGFAMALAELCGASQPLVLQLTSVRSSIVAAARNNAVAAARAFGAEALLFLDSDMVFPPTTLLRLLAHDRAIVGATYVRRVPPFDVLGAVLGSDQSPSPSGLVEMTRLPAGCLLVRMEVFDRLAEPWFQLPIDPATGAITGEDYHFCDAARRAGLRLWCDAALSTEIGHIGQAIYRLPGVQAEPS